MAHQSIISGVDQCGSSFVKALFLLVGTIAQALKAPEWVKVGQLPLPVIEKAVDATDEALAQLGDVLLQHLCLLGYQFGGR